MAVYLGTRVALLLTAVATGALANQGLSTELSNWDGVWYLAMAGDGFPRHVSVHQSTLGFLPLYGIVIWVVHHVLFCPLVVAGLLVSAAGGLVATVLVQRLVTDWRGAEAGLRAAVLFCVFPGSVVFSMVYAEGILVPLVVGCLLCLQRRRFLAAGALAALATATAADALVLVLVCAVAAVSEVRRGGRPGDEPVLRSVLAVLVAPLGAVAVCLFLWRRTGTPFATYDVQRLAWHEASSPLARVEEVPRLLREIGRGFRAADNWRQLNQVSDLTGTLYLFVAGAVVLRRKSRPPAIALALCAGIALLTLTSHGTAPNPRMLITAFPLVVVWAWALERRGFLVVSSVWSVLLVLMSAMTFLPVSLRP